METGLLPVFRKTLIYGICNEGFYLKFYKRKGEDKMKFWKKASRIALAAMLVAGLTAGCGGGGGEKKAADAGKEIVVGVNAELTGNVANYGKSMLSGFELAVEEANKAGSPSLRNPVTRRPNW